MHGMCLCHVFVCVALSCSSTSLLFLSCLLLTSSVSLSLMNSTCVKCCLPSSCILVHLHRYLHTGSVNVGMTYDLTAFSLFGLILEYSLTLYQSVFHAATAWLLTSLDCIENDFFNRYNLTSLLYLPALLQFACKFLFGSSDCFSHHIMLPRLVSLISWWLLTVCLSWWLWLKFVMSFVM